MSYLSSLRSSSEALAFDSFWQTELLDSIVLFYVSVSFDGTYGSCL